MLQVLLIQHFWRIPLLHINPKLIEQKLISHKSEKHPEIRDRNCTQCSFSSAYRNHLRADIKFAHQNIRKYNCTHCPYHKNHHRKHIEAVHRKVEDVTCPHCEYTATQNIHLIDH